MRRQAAVLCKSSRHTGEAPHLSARLINGCLLEDLASSIPARASKGRRRHDSRI